MTSSVLGRPRSGSGSGGVSSSGMEEASPGRPPLLSRPLRLRLLRRGEQEGAELSDTHKPPRGGGDLGALCTGLCPTTLFRGLNPGGLAAGEGSEITSPRSTLGLLLHLGMFLILTYIQ